MRTMTWMALALGALSVAGCGGAEFTATNGTGGSGGSGTAGGGGNGGSGATTAMGGNGGSGATTQMGGSGGNGGSGGSPNCVDADMDGVTNCDGDCNDNDPTVYPGAPELCGDNVDNACGDAPDPAAQCQGIGTYVSALIGDDNNPGTKELPVLTIGKGMLNAVQLSMKQPVFVAEGAYNENVTLVEEVDLWGGYSCMDASNCTWVRDSKKYKSEIVNQDADGIYAGHNISSKTEVDGFTITGKSGSPGDAAQLHAMFIQGSPVITNNIIQAGVVSSCGSGCGSRGITVSGAPGFAERAQIKRNTIVGGDSVLNTIAVEVTNGGTADIVANDITGGKGTWTRCIAVTTTSGQVSIAKNDLHAGSCAGNYTTFAIYVGKGVTASIDSNHINSNPQKLGTCPQFTGQWWTGGIESEGSEAVITNNVIYGVPSPRSTAVLLADCEGPCQVGQPTLINNTLDGLGLTSSVSNTSMSAAVVFKTGKPTQNVVVGKVRNNILLGGIGAFTFGAYEDAPVGSTAKPQDFQNNDIFDTNVLYREWNGAVALPYMQIDTVNMQVNGASANINADPMLKSDQHIEDTSPCVDAGTQSGGDTPTKDIDGEDRPKGAEVDIGADEAK